MSKFAVLYATMIAGKNYALGDEVEFAKGTDELFIKRLISIGCIKQVEDEGKESKKKERLSEIKSPKKPSKKEQKQEAEDEELDIEDIENDA